MSNLKILVIDDFEMTRVMIKKNLATLGFSNFEDAENGLEAFKKLKLAIDMNAPFDLVFCDWNMPVMSGIELLKQCRSTPGLILIPFIMVTAESESENVIKALMMGANDYIIKPFSPEVLTKKIDLILKKLK
ncbi:MAG: response regulator [Bacteriovorax sp.]|nr:response regulator [Bacteriovorax sp.]